ncbi:hypothetical protein AAJP47_06190 [Psychrobacter sp. B38]|uniref:hypothetical protein n=1 Tax=Psychrobacter sp. B38 TaxID=3143538 RepID=UPI00320F1C40
MSQNHKNPLQVKVSFKAVIISASLTALLVSSGCATSSLLESSNRVSTTSVKTPLSEDQIVAFGRPAQALPKMPNATMVIVGEKNSCVLSQGGTEMVNLLSNLTPKNIQVSNDMSFYVPNNDGYFQGEMKLSYAKLKDEFKRSDYQFFLQNNGRDCTTDSDERINAQRFCFSVPVKGAIYPQVSNLSMIQSQYRALSKPYTVSFYTQIKQDEVIRSGKSSAEKLVLLPFALAFDVVTFPLQLLDN